MRYDDFLVEVRTEELPPKSLLKLANALEQDIQAQLTKANLTFKNTQFFATPRRLAVWVHALAEQQPDSIIERKGPALAAAFDSAGKPTPACVGFATSCNVSVDALLKIQNEQGAWVGYNQPVAGKQIQALMPDIVKLALASLPIPKRMRWGSGKEEFIRPVHSVVMLYGKEVIHADILGVSAGHTTQGHRFHAPNPLNIEQPSHYQSTLKTEGFVIADFQERKNIIRRETENLVKNHFGNKATVVIEEDLLDEVTGLVEWPIAIFGNFEKKFLDVPAEVLISAMQAHQRYFHIIDEHKKLLPHFVTISNIESHDIQHVIAGNERVLRARLSDAAFFFEKDKKIPLDQRITDLKQIIFQDKLGNMHDKTQRIAQLAIFIAKKINVDPVTAERASQLAKTDLLTDMVKEFPELQGTMGRYYASHAHESPIVAQAIAEHYLPRFSGDLLPDSQCGQVVAIADRIDTLVGIFGIQLVPTGDKDPFGLRRAALGILRILIEKKLKIDMRELLQFSSSLYEKKLINPQVNEDVFHFMQERLKFWYQEQGVSADIFAAVAALNITDFSDFSARITAVSAFKKCPEAENLSVANKRVSNILSKYTEEIQAQDIDSALFDSQAEQDLAKQLLTQENKIAALSAQGDYTNALSELAKLRQPVDQFFDKVLVMDEDKKKRENRLLLLKKLRTLFLHVADVALLQTVAK